MPFIQDQAVGAYLVIFLLALRPLYQLFRTHFANRNEVQSQQNGQAPAVVALFLSVGVLIAVGVAAGLKLQIAVYFFLAYYAIAVIISRIRAEFGFPVNDLGSCGPTSVLMRVFGSRSLERRTLTVLTLFHWLNRVFRSHPMPHELEGMKLASRTGTTRSTWKWILVFSALAVPLGFWAYLHVYYKLGAGGGKVEIWVLGMGDENYRALDSWVNMPTDLDVGRAAAAGGGGLFVLGLWALHTRLLWFPFHPIAYPVATGWGMRSLWLPILIGGLAKWTVLRYGGLRGYRTLLPFFIGLMLGEFCAGCTWSLWGIFTGSRSYEFFP